ncbi:MAG: type II secretion system protein [Bacteriovoracaceae bacterium]|nr:type II secretion system protein [Bacteriovoracaceae bacterium]
MRRKEQKVQNGSKGFSLIEVMISIAIIGATALIFMYLLQEQHKSEKAVMKNAQLTHNLDEINRLLSDRASCTATLRSLSIIPSTGQAETVVPAMKSSDGLSRILGGVSKDGITPTFTLSSSVIVDTNATLGNFNYGRGYVTLNAYFEKTAPFTGPKNMKRTFQVMVNFCNDYEVHGANVAALAGVCTGTLLEVNSWTPTPTSNNPNPSPLWFGWCRTCPAGNIIQICE